MSPLTSKDVVAYLSNSSLKPGSAQVLASSLRSYFRFLRLHGECEEALLLAVPAPARRRQTMQAWVRLSKNRTDLPDWETYVC